MRENYSQWSWWRRFKCWWHGAALTCRNCGQCHASWQRECRTLVFPCAQATDATDGGKEGERG